MSYNLDMNTILNLLLKIGVLVLAYFFLNLTIYGLICYVYRQIYIEGCLTKDAGRECLDDRQVKLIGKYSKISAIVIICVIGYFAFFK